MCDWPLCNCVFLLSLMKMRKQNFLLQKLHCQAENYQEYIIHMSFITPQKYVTLVHYQANGILFMFKNWEWIKLVPTQKSTNRYAAILIIFDKINRLWLSLKLMAYFKVQNQHKYQCMKIQTLHQTDIFDWQRSKICKSSLVPQLKVYFYISDFKFSCHKHCFICYTYRKISIYVPCWLCGFVADFFPTQPLYCDIACCYLQTVAMVTQWRSATKDDNSNTNLSFRANSFRIFYNFIFWWHFKRQIIC